MATGDPLSLTCWSTLDLRSITPVCSLFQSPLHSLSFFPLLSCSHIHAYCHTTTQRCKHTHQHTFEHTHNHTQLLIQAAEETELNLKKQSQPAERTIHHDLCVSDVGVGACGCGRGDWKEVTATFQPLTTGPHSVFTSQYWSLNIHPHSSQGQLNCKWSYITTLLGSVKTSWNKEECVCGCVERTNKNRNSTV